MEVRERCGKCAGSGRVTPNWEGVDTCFCCGGKGERGASDKEQCVNYVLEHPKHTYFCVAQGYVDEMWR